VRDDRRADRGVADADLHTDVVNLAGVEGEFVALHLPAARAAHRGQEAVAKLGVRPLATPVVVEERPAGAAALTGVEVEGRGWLGTRARDQDGRHGFGADALAAAVAFRTAALRTGGAVRRGRIRRRTRSARVGRALIRVVRHVGVVHCTHGTPGAVALILVTVAGRLTRDGRPRALVSESASTGTAGAGLTFRVRSGTRRGKDALGALVVDPHRRLVVAHARGSRAIRVVVEHAVDALDVFLETVDVHCRTEVVDRRAIEPGRVHGIRRYLDVGTWERRGDDVDRQRARRVLAHAVLVAITVGTACPADGADLLLLRLFDRLDRLVVTWCSRREARARVGIGVRTLHVVIEARHVLELGIPALAENLLLGGEKLGGALRDASLALVTRLVRLDLVVWAERGIAESTEEQTADRLLRLDIRDALETVADVGALIDRDARALALEAHAGADVPADRGERSVAIAGRHLADIVQPATGSGDLRLHCGGCGGDLRGSRRIGATRERRGRALVDHPELAPQDELHDRLAVLRRLFRDCPATLDRVGVCGGGGEGERADDEGRGDQTLPCHVRYSRAVSFPMGPSDGHIPRTLPTPPHLARIHEEQHEFRTSRLSG